MRRLRQAVLPGRVRLQVTASDVLHAWAVPAGDRPSFDPGMPTQPIRDAATARTRIDEIKFRTLADGGYQALPVEGDRRQWFLNGLVIRSALGIAVMGFGVSNIAIALGASLMLIGGTSLAVGIPLILAAVD